MVPTRFVEDLWPGVAAGLATTDPALTAARRFDPAAATGRFRLGMHGYALGLLGPPLAAVIGKTAPGMTLELLAAGDPSADDALRWGSGSGPAVAVRRCFRRPVHPFAPDPRDADAGCVAGAPACARLEQGPVPGFDLIMLWSRRDDPAPARRWFRGVIAGLEP